MGGGGSQVTGSHAPSSQLPSSVHWRLNARLKGKDMLISATYFRHYKIANFQMKNPQSQQLLFSLPFGFVCDMVARLALVLAERAHFETGLIAAFSLQHSIGHRRGGRASKLTKGLWE